MYIDKWYCIVNKYNNTYHRTIKMKAVDAKPSIYTDFNKKNNKSPKFKVGDNVGENIKMSKYFCKKLRSKLVSRSFCD